MGMVELVLIAILVIGMPVLGIGLLLSNAQGKQELATLLRLGRRVRAKLVVVEGGMPAGRSGHTSYFKVPIELEYDEGRSRVRSSVVVPETLRSLVQAGAPCEVVLDQKDPAKLCIVSLENSFGVATAVTLGSMYSKW